MNAGIISTFLSMLMPLIIHGVVGSSTHCDPVAGSGSASGSQAVRRNMAGRSRKVEQDNEIETETYIVSLLFTSYGYDDASETETYIMIMMLAMTMIMMMKMMMMMVMMMMMMMMMIIMMMMMLVVVVMMRMMMVVVVVI